MASSLRSRLDAMKTQSQKPAPARAGGLLALAGTEDVPDSLYDIPAAALRRIGSSGRPFDIEKCLFIDTETTGLSGGAGTVAFLVGVGYISRGRMTIEQFFMRDYSDEPELLYRLKELMERFDTAVTFNGRNFDMPLISTRFVMNRLRDFRELDQLDLLYPSRRAWKLRIRSCRLANIEEQILGIARENDIPGSEVPQRFFEYLKSGDMALMNDIIRHNYQDILSLAFLLDRLAKVYASPEEQREAADLFSLGRALENQGEQGPAIRLYRLSALPARTLSASSLKNGVIAGRANMNLTRLLLRNGRYDEAKATLETMIRRCQQGIYPYIELAKLYEHRFRDCAAALMYTRKALEMCSEFDREEIEYRERRLLRKLSDGKEET